MKRYLDKLLAWAMQLVRRMGSRAYLALAIIFSLLILADHFGKLGLVDKAETKLFDSLISHRLLRPVPDADIVVIDIDEASLAGMAQEHGRWPWPNSVLGELVQGLERQGARAIVFDILFSDRDTLRPESDAAFNAVIAASKTTFFPMLRLDPQNDRLSRIPVGALPGAKPLQDAGDPNTTIAIILPKVPAALDHGRLGSHQVIPDKDGVIRRYPSWVEHAGWRIPSMPQRIAEEFGYPMADKPDVLLNWRGPPFTFSFVSFLDVYKDLKSDQKVRPSDEFSNKIVIIGSTAPSLFDVKGTPMARIHPGVEILATAIDNFKNGDGLRELPAWIMRLAALLLIWSMAIALYRQTRIEVFDTVFGVLQAGLVVVAFVVLNFSPWYLDMSAPLSLGVMYFTIARVYYGASFKWLANSQVRDMHGVTHGTRLLAVLAIRLKGAKPAEKRRMRGELDYLVARSKHGAGRILNLVEDPGFIRGVFADAMLVYWLCDDPATGWQEDADLIQASLIKRFSNAHQNNRLTFARNESVICWKATDEWTANAFRTILAALMLTVTPPAAECSPEN